MSSTIYALEFCRTVGEKSWSLGASVHDLQDQDKLRFYRKIGYSLGHFYNDLVSSLFVSYILIYVRLSVGLESNYAGYIFVVAQLSACIVSPIIGIIQDKYDCCQKLGTKICCYIAGAIISTLGFGILFNVTFGSCGESQLLKLVYYIPPTALYSSGYVMMQLPHLTILSELTIIESERVQLNSWRNAATLIGFLSVYCGVWILFTVQTGDNDFTTLTSKDVETFQIVSQIIIAVGLITSLGFCVLIKENLFNCTRCTEKPNVKASGDKENKLDRNMTQNHKRTLTRRLSDSKISCASVDDNVDDFIKEDFAVKQRRRNSIFFEPAGRILLRTILKEAMLYEVTIVYSCTAFAVIVTQMYIPLYITETLKMEKVAIGLLPLMLYFSGFVTCLLMKRLCKRFGVKKIFITGEILTLVSCLWIFFITSDSYQQIYAAIIVFGAGQATLNVTSLAMMTKFNWALCGLRFCDIWLDHFYREPVESNIYADNHIIGHIGNITYTSCSDFYRIVIVSSPGVATIIASIVMISRHVRDRKLEEKEERPTTRKVITKDGIDNSASGYNGEITHL